MHSEHRSPVLLLSAILAVCLAGGGAAMARQSELPEPVEPLSDQVVDYRIDVSLDPVAHTLSGKETLTWRNTTNRPTSELQFHLYLNAFKNDRSTFMRESLGRSRSYRMREGGWGFTDVVSIRRSDGQELRPLAEFISPDDGNPDDETVLRVPLPEPVGPGESITLDIDFEAQMPRVFARTGHKGNFHLVGQWFPKIGVLQESGWNCHQFHSNSEFFADFGTYDVSITLPESYVIGATGEEVGEPVRNADGTATHRFVQADVHDFAWTADTDHIRVVRPFVYEEQRDPIEEQRVARAMGWSPDSERIRLTDVEVTLLIRPEHEKQIDRHFAAVFNAIKYFGYWYGRYPYSTLTVVDPVYGGRGAGGMEYPTLITAGTRYFVPAGRQVPEGVTVHEFGHQYWYGLVATNEFEEAFLDEGFNTYSTGLVLDKAYGPNHDQVDLAPGIPYLAVPLVDIPLGPAAHEEYKKRAKMSFSEKVVDFLLMRPFGPSDDLALNAFRDLPFLNYEAMVPIDQVTHQRRRYLRAPKHDEMARRSWEYYDRTSYGLNSYARPALVLRTLGGILGQDAMLRVMRTYHERYRFRHPTISDFIATVNEVAGRPMDDFFEQAIFGSMVMDYAVSSTLSEHLKPGRGIFGGPEDRTSVTMEEVDRIVAERGEDAVVDFETKVKVRRLGGFVWPQEIEMRFTSGGSERTDWDGEYRWMSIEKNDRELQGVRVDPEEKMALDTNRSNNSRSSKRDPMAGLKGWSRALQWMQHVVYFYSGVS